MTSDMQLKVTYCSSKNKYFEENKGCDRNKVLVNIENDHEKKIP